MALHHFTEAQQVLPHLARFYFFCESNKVFAAAEKAEHLTFSFAALLFFLFER